MAAQLPKDPGRKRPAHYPAAESGNLSVIIFVTVCTKERRPLLANPSFHELVQTWWLRASSWRVGRYVILPDHVHFFCAPGTVPPTPLRPWISYWKNGVSRDLKSSEPVWQRDFWDTQLRLGESYSAKWEYVRSNPVRHGLVNEADLWPYQGELDVLQWHEP